MFLAHFAVGFAGKRADHSPSLGTWIMAAQWLDLVWPVLLLLGWERVRIAPGWTPVAPLEFVHYPYTHSLLAVLAWAVGFALVYRLLRGNTRAAVWLGMAVLSHWVLDFISHRPDLPLFPGGEARVGLYLWASLWGTLVVELGLLVAGVALYMRAFPARDRVGVWALGGLLLLLVVAYFGSIFAPPPETTTQLAAGALSMWLLVAWGYWIDRHRGAP
ncbi:MAG: hypothetical protein HY342_04270 [Candidatus Lambdaproteobacteria bacterium]|nr:hypothetical protein [Candidatus Lambdaproteobacteria bacterium]